MLTHGIQNWIVALCVILATATLLRRYLKKSSAQNTECGNCGGCSGKIGKR